MSYCLIDIYMQLAKFVFHSVSVSVSVFVSVCLSVSLCKFFCRLFGLQDYSCL